MPSIHRDREPTYEQGDAGSGVAPVEHESVPEPAVEPEAELVEQIVEHQARRRSRGPRRPSTATAQAGHAGGAGEASGA